jgi:hypothetical protein
MFANLSLSLEFKSAYNLGWLLLYPPCMRTKSNMFTLDEHASVSDVLQCSNSDMTNIAMYTDINIS